MAERITDCELLPDEEWGDGWELRRLRVYKSLPSDKWCVRINDNTSLSYLSGDGGVCLGGDRRRELASREEAERALLLWLMTRAA